MAASAAFVMLFGACGRGRAGNEAASGEVDRARPAGTAAAGTASQFDSTSTVPTGPSPGVPGPIEPAATFPPVPELAEQVPTVEVELKDGAISVDPRTLIIGIPYKFSIANRGRQPHSLEVRTAAVQGSPGRRVFELESAPLRPGESREVFVTFRLPGPYEIACPLEGHAEAGERAELAVP